MRNVLLMAVVFLLLAAWLAWQETGEAGRISSDLPVRSGHTGANHSQGSNATPTKIEATPFNRGPTGPVVGEGLIIALLDERETPIGEGKVYRFTGEGVVDRAAVNGSGMAAFETIISSRPSYMFAQDNRMPFRFELEHHNGTQTVVVPDMNPLAGTVTLSDRIPMRSIALQLLVDSTCINAGHLPIDLCRALRFNPGAPLVLKTTTAYDGTFRFTGLPNGYLLTLQSLPTYRLKGDSQGPARLRLEGHRTGVAFELFPVATVVGEVVGKESGLPQPGLRVRCSVVPTNGSPDTLSLTTATSQAGSFRFLIPVGEWKHVSLEVYRYDQRVWSSEPLGWENHPDFDVGRIVIDEGPRLSALVQDRQGRPISGAVLSCGPLLSESLSSPSDDAGRATIRIRSGATSIWVGAVGYRLREVPVPGDSRMPLLVTLDPGPTLNVHVKAAQPDVLRDLSVMITGTNVFDGPYGKQHPALVAAGAASGTVIRYGQQVVFGIETGRTTVYGLRPDQSVVVQLHDGGRSVVASMEVVIGSVGGTTASFKVDGAPRDIRGVVTGPGGEPIAGATVLLGHSDGPKARTRTDSLGHFRVSGLMAERVSILVDHGGYCIYRERDAVVSALSEPLLIRLRPARSVTVAARDESNRVLDCRNVRAKLADGDLVDSDKRVGARWIVRRVPAEAITVIVEVGGCTYSKRHDAAIPDCWFEIQGLGDAIVTWQAELTEPFSHTLEFKPLHASRAASFEVVIVHGKSRYAQTVSVLPGHYEVALVEHDHVRKREVAIASGNVRVKQDGTVELALTKIR